MPFVRIQPKYENVYYYVQCSMCDKKGPHAPSTFGAKQQTDEEGWYLDLCPECREKVPFCGRQQNGV